MQCDLQCDFRFLGKRSFIIKHHGAWVQRSGVWLRYLLAFAIASYFTKSRKRSEKNFLDLEREIRHRVLDHQQYPHFQRQRLKVHISSFMSHGLFADSSCVHFRNSVHLCIVRKTTRDNVTYLAQYHSLHKSRHVTVTCNTSFANLKISRKYFACCLRAAEDVSALLEQASRLFEDHTAKQDACSRSSAAMCTSSRFIF